MNFLILGLLASIHLGANGAEYKSAQEKETDPNVAVYGGVVLDLGGMKERSLPWNNHVEDCSTPDYQCVAGVVFRLAVPRRCQPFERGQTFVSGPVTTNVLAAHSGAETQTFGPPYGGIDTGIGMGPMTVLGNPDQRWVVYIYSASALAAIYYDPDKTADLYGAATADGIPGLRDYGGANNRYLGRLETIRPVFGCERP